MTETRTSDMTPGAIELPTNERELLELAARAASVHPHDIECTWNPLTDDGDALRLAVKLGIRVCGSNHEATIDRCAWYHGIKERDPYAATRLAIVSAAASLGAAQTRESPEA